MYIRNLGFKDVLYEQLLKTKDCCKPIQNLRRRYVVKF